MKLLILSPAAIGGGTGAFISVTPLRDWAVLLVTVIGGIGTVVAIYWNWRVSRSREHANNVEAERLMLRLCAECQHSFEDCPLAKQDRPAFCPKKRLIEPIEKV